MSLLPNQSAVNLNISFWGNTSSPPIPGNFAFVASPTSSTTTIPFEKELVPGEQMYFGTVNIPTINDYDVEYVVYGSMNFNNADEQDTEDFSVGLFGSSTSSSSLANYRANKRWFNISVIASWIVPAGVDGESIGFAVQNTSEGETFTALGNATITVIGFPIPP